MDAYTLIARVDEAGFAGLQEHEGIRYVDRTIGAFSAFAAYDVADNEELGRIGRDIEALAGDDLRTYVAVDPPPAAPAGSGVAGPGVVVVAQPRHIPLECIDPITLVIDWECVEEHPPHPSHSPKTDFTAFAVVTTRRGAAGDGGLALHSAPLVRAYCELSDPGSWLAELGSEDPDDLVWAVDQLARGEVFVRVRSGLVVRGRSSTGLVQG